MNNSSEQPKSETCGLLRDRQIADNTQLLPAELWRLYVARPASAGRLPPALPPCPPHGAGFLGESSTWREGGTSQSALDRRGAVCSATGEASLGEEVTVVRQQRAPGPRTVGQVSPANFPGVSHRRQEV